MDPEALKNDFKRLRSMKNRMENSIAETDSFIDIAKRGKLMCLKDFLEHRELLVDVQKECNRRMVTLYKSAIVNDVDIDGTRLLKVYQFFFRNISQIGMLLRHLPRGSNAIWGIVILTAIIFLYAAC
ncbi:hypothetical protein CAEBREN_11648 [Caenorhabditis brenneri]|uniref:Uncharacterized protein n=1 Tax=Caenorhabditis brenneri TaxID=135651 RepID=G0MNC8_CAEBE|nr:hypothetical protein CAEBREN_11648 [Caenorhabditis brenneri]